MKNLHKMPPSNLVDAGGWSAAKPLLGHKSPYPGENRLGGVSLWPSQANLQKVQQPRMSILLDIL